MKPVVLQQLTIRIRSARSIERNALSNRYVHLNGRRATLSVHYRNRIVIGMSVIRDGPRHTRCKIILKSLPPAPDRRLVGNILLAICANDSILEGCMCKLIASLRPDGVRFAIGLAVNVTPPPPAPIRPPICIQAIINKPEKRRG